MDVTMCVIWLRNNMPS